MHIPNYWAQHRLAVKHRGRDTYIQRFGWSDNSQQDAQFHARQRCQDALSVLVHTGKVRFFDVKDSYLGLAHKLPIKEEVLQRFDDGSGSVLTVNSYGTSCLNVPDVMILDVDHEDILVHLVEQRQQSKPREIPLFWALMLAIAVCVILTQLISFYVVLALFIPVIFIIAFMTVWLNDKRQCKWQQKILEEAGGYDEYFTKMLSAFVQENAISFRLYATPSGFRLIATNRHYLPNDEMVQRCAKALLVDQRYAHLCQIQQCFRARVTAKPWRMASNDLGALPTKQFWADEDFIEQNELFKLRQTWLKDYHAKARQYRACRFVASFGVGADDGVLAFVTLHDRLCQSECDLPMA